MLMPLKACRNLLSDEGPLLAGLQSAEWARLGRWTQTEPEPGAWLGAAVRAACWRVGGKGGGHPTHLQEWGRPCAAGGGVGLCVGVRADCD
jgi:hypothetical protein